MRVIIHHHNGYEFITTNSTKKKSVYLTIFEKLPLHMHMNMTYINYVHRIDKLINKILIRVTPVQRTLKSNLSCPKVVSNHMANLEIDLAF